MILPNKLNPNEFGSDPRNLISQFRLGWNAAIDESQKSLDSVTKRICSNFCKYGQYHPICEHCPLGGAENG